MGHANKCRDYCGRLYDGAGYGSDCCSKACASTDDKDSQKACSVKLDESGQEVQTGGYCNTCNCLTTKNSDISIVWVKRKWQDVFTDISTSVGYYIERTADDGLDFVEGVTGMLEHWWVWLIIVAAVVVVVVVVYIAIKYGGKKKKTTGSSSAPAKAKAVEAPKSQTAVVKIK